MSVVEITAPGGPEVLRLATRPVPQPRPGEVLIRVGAAGLNRPDVFQRRGHYEPPPGASDLPGLEVAGMVAALGSPDSKWSVGDPLCALLAGGGYAEYCIAPEPQCLPVPKSLGLVEAAALPETFFTVWANVFEGGRLAAGETLLVHGGSSGIGTTAIQLGVAFSARVFTTAGTPEKVAACQALGAERAVHYPTEDFSSVVRSATQGRGVDVILDMVGGPYLAPNLATLAEGGRLVIIASLGGARSEIDLATLYRRRLTVTGSVLRPRKVEEKGRIARELRARVWPLLESGRVRPVIAKRFPLDSASEAHAYMESGNHIGKIVLTTRFLEGA